MSITTDFPELEFGEMAKKREAWLDAFKDVAPRDLIAVARIYNGDGYTFYGTYRPALVDILGRHPDSDEIIMHVEGGVNEGAVCTVCEDYLSFRGCVFEANDRPKLSPKLTDVHKRAIMRYAANNMSRAATAHELMYHRNSCAYHMDVVHKETGLNPRNFYELQQLIELIMLDAENT